MADTSGFAAARQSVGEIAADLPGASAVFRRFGIEFCCQGHVTLQDAADHRGLDPRAVEAALGALDPDAAPEAPRQTAALIDHIRTRYHDVHRRQLSGLIALSETVETAHLHHPRAPLGLTQALSHFRGELETLMDEQETMLFPALTGAVTAPTGLAIRNMRHNHGQYAAIMDRIDRMTDNSTVPADACASWRALYADLARFRADLIEHLHLENNVLFPRFDTASHA